MSALLHHTEQGDENIRYAKYQFRWFGYNIPFSAVQQRFGMKFRCVFNCINVDIQLLWLLCSDEQAASKVMPVTLRSDHSLYEQIVTVSSFV